MKFIYTLAAFLMLTSLGVRAERNFGAFDQGPTNNVQSSVMADAIFDQLYNSGALGDIDDETAALTKELTRNLLANPEVMRDIKNGTLKLDEEFVNYAFGSKIKDAGKKAVSTVKDAGKKTISAVKDVGGKVIDKTKYAARKVKVTFKKVAPKVIKTSKELAKSIAATSNKVMTAIVENDKLMAAIEKTVDVASTLAPIVSPILGAALLAVPGGAMLIAPLSALTSVLIALDGEDVSQFLTAVQATTNLADAVLNNGDVLAASADAATEIGKTVISAVSEKPVNPKTQEDVKIAGDTVKILNQSAVRIVKFCERKDLTPDQQQAALNALDQINRVNRLLDTSKLGLAP